MIKRIKKITNNPYHIFFKNLANPLKIKIIIKLKEKPFAVKNLAKELNEEQSKISHALYLLKHCSIVNSKEKGRARIYKLNKKTILPILKIIDKHKIQFCKGIKEKNKIKIK